MTSLKRALAERDRTIAEPDQTIAGLNAPGPLTFTTKAAKPPNSKGKMKAFRNNLTPTIATILANPERSHSAPSPPFRKPNPCQA